MGKYKKEIVFPGKPFLLFWVNKHFYCFHKSGSFTPSARLHFVILFGIQIKFYKAYHSSRHGYICLNQERGNLINLLYIEYQIIGNYLYCISAIPAPSNWWEIMYQIITCSPVQHIMKIYTSEILWHCEMKLPCQLIAMKCHLLSYLKLILAKLDSEIKSIIFSGEYVCQVSAFKPTQIHHTVKIRGK